MMDLELRIAQYIDGELSGEEEGELHHLLAVSPEARVLFRQHLTLHSVARDERLLHRPTQSMRDDLFARLQAEEGMKPSAVLPVASATGGIFLSDSDSGVPADVPSLPSGSAAVEGRPPVASGSDPRTEERRRRRRLIPILIPLLLCVIVGGVWYGGGFGGDRTEGYLTENGVERQAPASVDREHADRAGASEPAVADNAAVSDNAARASSETLAGASRPTERSAASSSSARRTVEPEREMLAMRLEEKRQSHDVLGISTSSRADIRGGSDNGNFEPMEDLAVLNVGGEPTVRTSPLNADRDFGLDIGGNEEDVAPLQSGSMWDMAPETSSVFAASRDAEGFEPVDFAGADNGSGVSAPLTVTMSNSISRSELGLNDHDDHADHVVRSGHLTDSSTGLPIRATLENYEAIAAMLERNGLDADGDGTTPKLLATGPVNPGTRAMNESAFSAATAQSWNIPDAKGANAPPVVMSDVMNEESTAVQSDSLLSLAENTSPESREKRMKSPEATSVPATIRGNKSASRSASAEMADAPLDAVGAATPRRLSFFVGLDQSMGAAVSSVEVVLPSPTPSLPSFSEEGGIFPETRAVVGIDFDGGRQRAFAAVGVWAYEERTSVRSRSAGSTTTLVREEQKTAYEIWGGAGYRYSVRVAESWSAGAEIWGGVGAEYIHGGLAVPVSYELKENLRLEFAPGLRYRGLHGDTERTTAGTSPSVDFQEQIVTPRDEQRLEASFGIGLILLLR